MKSFVCGAFAATFFSAGAAPADDVTLLSDPIAAPMERSTSCEPVNFRVYFPKGSTDITPDGRALIDAAVRNVAGCERVTVLIGADLTRIQTEENRVTTSERSAEILSVLRETGVSGDVFVGEADEELFKNGQSLGGRSLSPDYIHVAVAPTEDGKSAAAAGPEYKI